MRSDKGEVLAVRKAWRFFFARIGEKEKKFYHDSASGWAWSFMRKNWKVRGEIS